MVISEEHVLGPTRIARVDIVVVVHQGRLTDGVGTASRIVHRTSIVTAVPFVAGYFGIQELKSSTNKVVIFSVWDPTKGDNPNAVPNSERVEVLHNDPDVRIKRFGGEGTGGQSMWTYPWPISETNRFFVRATTQETKTAYAAYFFVPEEKRWKHLATFRTHTKALRSRATIRSSKIFGAIPGALTRYAADVSAIVG